MSTPTNTYDFIVVGAGTAGCVIAARLSENANARVLLLEAGGATASPASGVPAAWPMLLATESAWGDSTVVQAAPEKAMPFIRGRGIGGSSAINAMMFARGHRACYDSWEQAGATGWGFDALLPYFKRSETAVGGDPALRGVNGPLLVAPPNPPNELATAGLSASVESGYARATDVSGGLEIGFGLVDLNIVDGQRQSAADAYLTPALHRANLDFVADTVVHRLWIEGGRCTGVVYSTEGASATALVWAGEVVLTAGAIGSPQVLLQSGIGPQSHLFDVGVEVVHDLPGVGANLHDHPIGGIIYRGAVQIPETRFNHCEAIGLIRSEFADTAPDLQVMFTDLAGNGIGTEEPLENCYTIAVSVMQPFSRGTIRLSGPCAGATPLIDPNYLGDDRDIRTMVTGLRLAREIGQASAFDAWRGDELVPGPAAEDNEILSAATKHSFMSYFHPVGTCAMGNNTMSVVDSELRVHGIDGLRVADGSVMPSIPSNHTNATVYAIAERAAALIEGERAAAS